MKNDNVNDNETKLLGTRAAAEILGVGQARIRQLCLAGDLQARKLGRDWFIEKAELKRYMDSRR